MPISMQYLKMLRLHNLESDVFWNILKLIVFGPRGIEHLSDQGLARSQGDDPIRSGFS
jgi:hypothetical protein